MLRPRLERADAALLEGASEAQVSAITRLDEVEVEAPTHALTIWANANTRHMSSVPPEVQAARSAAMRPLFERFLAREAAGEARWCGTAFPCHAAAQDAGMSLGDWEDFVYRAGHLEDADPIAFWREQSKRQAAIAERFKGVREIRIVAENTDLVLDVAGRIWDNADGHKNFPDGEVYTSPVESSTRGHIAFSFDATYMGNDVAGVRLKFDGGRVVEHEATRGAEFPRADARHGRWRALPRRGGVRHERRDPVADARHTLRREDRRDVPRRARDGVSGMRRHQHVGPSLGPGLRPAARRRDPCRRRGHLARRAVPASDAASSGWRTSSSTTRCRWARATPSSSRARRSAEELIVELVRAAIRAGAIPRVRPSVQGTDEAYLARASDEQLDHLPPWSLDEMGSIDARISVVGAWNTVS